MRKLLALLLALCMLAGLMPAALADDVPETGEDRVELPVEEIDPPENVESTGETRGEARHDNDEEILAVVVLTAPSLVDLYIESGNRGASTGSDRSKFFSDALASGKDEELMAAQEPVLDAIRAVTGDAGLAPVSQMVTLFNGFFIKVKYGDLGAIREIEGVAQAYESHVFSAPDPVAVGTQLQAGEYESHSYDMVGLAQAWAESWTGKGMVVAVLDTGLDLEYSTYWDPDEIDQNEYLTGEDGSKIPNPNYQKPGWNVTKIRHTHEAFTNDSFLSDDPDTFIKWKEEEINEMISKLDVATKKIVLGDLTNPTGFYKNRKVPYAFDYAGTVDPETYQLLYGDRNVYPGVNGSDHGTHVSGIILGCAKTKDGGIKFSGIAPDAQLLMMKVFDDTGAGASELSFAYALEDALLLGADVINMSYGSDNGFEDDESSTMEYYARLEEAGVILMTSAGNSGNSTANTNYGGHNLTTDPETSMMSSPAVYKSNVAVASINNTVTALSVLQWSYDDGTTYDAHFNDPNYEAVRHLFSDEYIKSFGEKGIPIIPAGEGNTLDFELAGFVQQGAPGNEGVTGIALVKRGGENDETGEALSFADKINNATRYAWTYTDEDGTVHSGGVLAVFVYDSDPNSDSLIAMSVAGTALTSAFISGRDGGAMMDAAENGGAYLTKVNRVDSLVEDEAEGGKMSYFSSWGAGPGLELKPDITDPGGNIWSSVFDYSYPYDTKEGTYTDYVGGYSMMSGTSMAAPHMAGMGALVRQYVREKIVNGDIDSTFNQEDEITNALLVSTAVPQTEGEAYYSPRYQGAGLANVGYAVTSPAYITVKDQLVGKLEFGDDYQWKGSFDGDFTIHNITGSPLTYSGKIVVMVPDTAKAVNTAVPNGQERDVMLDQDRVLKIIDLDGITVDANGEQTVHVDIDLTDEEIESLKALFPNGVYIEGFVILESEGRPNIGLPFLGYLGDWTTPPIFDAHTWLESKDGSLWNNENTWANSVLGFYNGYGFINLGQNPMDEYSETYQEVYHEENIAISPTGLVSGINDFLLYQLRDARVIVLEARDAETDELYYRDVEPFLPKTLYNGDYATAVPMSAMYMTEYWDGTKMGASQPNGTFTGTGDPLSDGTKVIFTIAAFGEGDYSALGETTLNGRTVTNYWALDLSDEKLWPTFNGHEMNMDGDVISFTITIDRQRPRLKDGMITSYTDNGRRYITGTVTDNMALAGMEIVPQVLRRDKNSGTEDVAFDYNSSLYAKMIYDAALQEWTFVADVTEVEIDNDLYEGTGYEFEYEWTGGLLVSAMDYAGNEGDFVTRVNPDGSEPDSDLTVTPNSGILYVGDTFDFSVIDNSAAGGLEFESSDIKVATVNAAGHVEAIAKGQAVITVSNGNGAVEKVVIAVRERPTEATDFKLSLEHFEGLTPDGALIVKIQDVQPADVLLGGSDGLLVSWSIREDDEVVSNIPELMGIIDVAQYTTDAMTGEIYLYASVKLDASGQPIFQGQDLSGTATLTVTLGGTRNEDGTVNGGLAKTMTVEWDDLYDNSTDDGLMSSATFDGEQVIYTTLGTPADLMARYRIVSEHDTVPARLYTAVGASSPSSTNPQTAATGLKLDGPDFVGTDAEWQGYILNDAGYDLPESIRLFTRYDDGEEIELVNAGYMRYFEYDKTTGHITVYHGPAGTDSEMIIRADGVKNDGAAGSTRTPQTYTKPDGLYGPFNWVFESGVEGTLTNTTNGATFEAKEPGVSYITAKSQYLASKNSGHDTVRFAVVTLPVTATTMEVATSDEGREGHMLEMEINDTDKLNIVLDPVPTEEKDRKVNWTSHNEEVVTVDQEGNVTAVGAGYAFISVMLDNRDADSGSALETYYVIHVTDPDNPEPEPTRKYTVTFRDGTDPSVVLKQQTYDKDAPIGQMPTPPEHPGYRFTRWEDGNGNTVTASTVVTSSMNVFARYSVISGGGVPGVPSTPKDPVVTTNDVEREGEVSTETRAKPEATVEGSTATAEITEAMGDEMIKQALANGSESVGVIMEPSEGVSSFKATFPGSVIADIAEKTDAALCMEAPVIDFDIPNGVLAELGGCDTLTVIAEKENGAVTFDILADGKSVGDTVGSLKAKLDLKYGEVAVLVHPDGTETIIPKSEVENGGTYVVLDGCGTVKVINNSKNFDDVHSEWFSSAVSFVSSHELFNGVSATSFAPEANMTRADLATVLWRLESKAQADGDAIDFTDVDSGVYYAEGVEWASSEGIISGTAPGLFEPVRAVTRQEMVTMIYRYAKALGLDVTEKSDLKSFKDAGDVDDWARDAMEWAVANGIIQGSDDSTLAPDATATRAQVAAIMERLVDVIVK